VSLPFDPPLNSILALRRDSFSWTAPLLVSYSPTLYLVTWLRLITIDSRVEPPICQVNLTVAPRVTVNDLIISVMIRSPPPPFFSPPPVSVADESPPYPFLSPLLVDISAA